ncbi:uncharacterized protein M6B38_152945 [Iris pallida]|uniref:Uncharacterized protein n=1 Tax=Iris pallida TaxID=29817 RepID=A0AAX6F552_IRIPA|nr:uncharacterized protein M6B38_152945 [Iris pallida]
MLPWINAGSVDPVEWSGSDDGCGYAEELEEAHAELAMTGLGDGNRPAEAAFAWRRIRSGPALGSTTGRDNGEAPESSAWGRYGAPDDCSPAPIIHDETTHSWLAAQARSRWGGEAVEVRALVILSFVVLFSGCVDMSRV